MTALKGRNYRATHNACFHAILFGCTGISLLLGEKLALLSSGAALLHFCTCHGNKQLAYLSGMAGADSNTAHTGNALFYIDFGWIIGGDGPYRTLLGTKSTLHTGLPGFRLHGKPHQTLDRACFQKGPAFRKVLRFPAWPGLFLQRQ